MNLDWLWFAIPAAYCVIRAAGHCGELEEKTEWAEFLKKDNLSLIDENDKLRRKYKLLLIDRNFLIDKLKLTDNPDTRP